MYTAQSLLHKKLETIQMPINKELNKEMYIYKIEYCSAVKNKKMKYCHLFQYPQTWRALGLVK